MNITCAMALLLTVAGCSNYDVRCTGPLRPINAAEPAVVRMPVAPSASALGAAATSQAKVPTGIAP